MAMEHGTSLITSLYSIDFNRRINYKLQLSIGKSTINVSLAERSHGVPECHVGTLKAIDIRSIRHAM